MDSTVEEIRLIAGAKHGDRASFEALVERYMSKAIAVAMGYVGNRHDALDLTQEAFYRVLKSLDRFREGEPFAPWFFRILRNACLNLLEKRRRTRALPLHRTDGGDEWEIPLPDGALSPLQVSEASEDHRQLRRAIEQLSLKHREIILLRHFQDLEYAAIASVLDIPIGTVMSRLFHARKKLKALLEDHMEGVA